MTDNLPSTELEVITPTVVGLSEFDLLLRQAEVLACSSIVPSNYQDKWTPNRDRKLQDGVANIMVAAMTGRTFGLDPLTAMRSFTVINGTPTLKPEFMLALIRRAGHQVKAVRSDSKGAVIWSKRRDTGEELESIFDEAEAKQAGLLPAKTGSGWDKYPTAMMWARAVSKLGRMLYSDLFLGASYTAEELGGPESQMPDAPIVVQAQAGPPAMSNGEREVLVKQFHAVVEDLVVQFGEDGTALTDKVTRLNQVESIDDLGDTALRKVVAQINQYMAKKENEREAAQEAEKQKAKDAEAVAWATDGDDTVAATSEATDGNGDPW